MVRVDKSATRLVVAAEAYALRHEAERPWNIALLRPDGRPLLDLFCGGALEPPGGRDALTRIEPPLVRRDGDLVRVTLAGGSERWPSRSVVVHCGEDDLSFRLEATGAGRIARCRLLRGLLADDIERVGLGQSSFRPPYHRPFGDLARGCAGALGNVWSARPNAAERDLFAPWEDIAIDCDDDPLRHGGLDSFLPAPAVVALQTRDGEWIGVGCAGPAAERDFHRFAYRGGETFGFELEYEPSLVVTDGWHSPDLVFCLGAHDPIAALRALISWQDARKQISHWLTVVPAWWRAPVFDGSGLADLAAWLDALVTLEERGLSPGTLWLGDAARAAAWTDLSEFVDRQHEAGRRVIVDRTLSDRQVELPEAPTDGVRVTSTSGVPGGFAAVHAALASLREALRARRDDALLIAPTVSPWFADVVDMVPLGSLWTDRASILPMLRARADIAHLASPAWLLAISDRACPSRAAWRELVAAWREIGVPVLTTTGVLASGELLREEDWELLRESWKGRMP